MDWSKESHHLCKLLPLGLDSLGSPSENSAGEMGPLLALKVTPIRRECCSLRIFFNGGKISDAITSVETSLITAPARARSWASPIINSGLLLFHVQPHPSPLHPGLL